MTEFYAHSLPGKPPSEWHKLGEHLRSTAERARQFAEPFGSGDWAWSEGLLHDVKNARNKMSKEYEVSFEIAGPAAMFTRPDTGSAFTSYPVPTYSAAKGMFEAVARIKTAYIKPVKVDVCCPIRYHKYVTNYGGPLRKAKSVTKKESYQLMALILVDVCYRVYGVVEECGTPGMDTHGKPLNHRHFLQDKFETRLRNGRFYYVPCLGWKEFVPSYMGPFRVETTVNTTINETISSMLFSVFDKPVNGERNPEFRYDLKISKGVFEYDQRDR